jgi:ubiquinol-cytochrome c reductase cytochrome b subunit
MEGVAVAGTYLTFLLSGGQFPGTEFISHFYITHVLLIPGLIAVPLTGPGIQAAGRWR